MTLTAAQQREADKFGAEIDRLENLVGALTLPLPSAMHVNQLKVALPDVVARLKESYVGLIGENPWE